MKTKITRIELSDILSFGHKQCINEIPTFNLLIGKNGAGKTNLLRIFGDLDSMLSYQSFTIQDIMGKFIHAHQASIKYEFQNEEVVQRFEIPRKNHSQTHPPIVNILIKYTKEFHNGRITHEELVFKDSFQINGNYGELKESISFIDRPMSDEKFYETFLTEITNNQLYFYLLNFGFLYIFSEKLFISNNGLLYRNYTLHENGKLKKTGGRDSYDPVKWSSGTLHCAKVIIHTITSRSILIFDEIDRHLEPRIIRRLMHFIFWLGSYGSLKNKQINSPHIDIISNLWQKIDKEKLSPYRAQPNAMDNANLTNFEKTGIRLHQIFISAHSSVLIDEFIRIGNSAKIHELSLKLMDNHFNPNCLTRGFNANPTESEKIKGKTMQKSLFTSVRTIESNAYSILDNLGVKGSDTLQTNGGRIQN